MIRLFAVSSTADAEEVYVDVQTQQLIINATACIGAHLKDGQRCMQASVSQKIMNCVRNYIKVTGIYRSANVPSEHKLNVCV